MLRQMERSTIHLLAKRGRSIRQIAAELIRENAHIPAYMRGRVRVALSPVPHPDPDVLGAATPRG